jgi:hypothetical protein
MRRHLRWYGASPLHLLALLACFGLAGYAAARLIRSQPLGVATWFLGAVIGHDLLLMPLYSLADRSVMAAIRHREPQLPVTPWINYVRVPAALSGLLLLVWFPLILRLQSPYHASTTLSADPYVWHWLAVTGALFLLSAVAFAVRLRGTREHAPLPEGEGPARPVEGDGTSATGTATGTGPADGDRARDDRPREEEEGAIAETAEPAAQQAVARPAPEEPEATVAVPPETAARPTLEATVAGPRDAAAGCGPQATATDPGTAGPASDQTGRSAAAGEGDPG